jgi:predicted component of type VI protein secretion system
LITDAGCGKSCARIEHRFDGVFLVDSISSSGCHVNGTRVVDRRARLSGGDLVHMGRTPFVFTEEEQDDPMP